MNWAAQSDGEAAAEAGAAGEDGAAAVVAADGLPAAAVEMDAAGVVLLCPAAAPMAPKKTITVAVARSTVNALLRVAQDPGAP